jgi:hypothetical protein
MSTYAPIIDLFGSNSVIAATGPADLGPKAPLVFVCTAALSPRLAPTSFHRDDNFAHEALKGSFFDRWHPAAGRGRGVGRGDASARERWRRHTGGAAVDAALLVRALGQL